MALAAAGAAWAGLAVLDPRAALPAWPGLIAAGAAAGWAARSDEVPSRARIVAIACALLAAVYAIDAQVTPNLGADSRTYFVFLPAALRGQGVDFSGVFRDWGLPDLARDSWLLRGVHPVGPALVWTPFYLLAHVYVLAGRALGRTAYEADGLSAPYVRATSLATGLVVVLGAVTLFTVLRRRHSRDVAMAATALALLATPLPFYVVVQPAMAHGIVFGVAALFLAAWTAAEREPTAARWSVLGGVFGLLVLMRWQAAVAGVLPALLALRDLRRRRIGVVTLARAAGFALLAFAPQMLAWKAQHGRWITNPQGGGYVDWTSPHLVDVLFSADRGLFAWTPVCLLAVGGLLWALRREPLLAGGGLAILGLTTWVNGGVRDWTGNDAFGARRFDLVIPLFALGLGVVVEGIVRLVARRPILAPAALGALLVAWNLGLMRLHARGTFPEAAPLDRVASAEAGLVRHAAERTLGALFGARGRNFAYRFFVGEYFYENVGLGGTIAVGGDDARYLGEGWSGPRWHEGGPRFRWALFPRACVLLPLSGPITVPALLTARVPRRMEDQTFTVRANGTPIGVGRLGPEWADVPFTLAAGALVAGENRICFEFERGWGEEGEQVAAQVARVQLP